MRTGILRVLDKSGWYNVERGYSEDRLIGAVARLSGFEIPASAGTRIFEIPLPSGPCVWWIWQEE